MSEHASEKEIDGDLNLLLGRRWLSLAAEQDGCINPSKR